MSKMNDWSKGILVLGFFFFLGSFISMPQEGIAGEKILKLGETAPVTNLDPASSSYAQITFFCRNIFQGLLRYKFNSLELEGDLAKSWKISEDGLVYTFKLRENVKWHQGFGEVTAHDVKFSFSRVMDPATNSPFAGEVKAAGVKEVKAIDDHTVEIHLKNRNAGFLHNCARPRPVGIVSKKVLEKYGKDFARNPIGSGPFMVQSMSREQLVLAANPGYWEGPPKIDRVIYRAIPDVDTQVMALEKGEIDMVWILPREKAVMDRLKASGLKMKLIDRGTQQFIMFNPQVKPFADVRVRRAVAHAIDRDAIVEHVLGGMAKKVNSLVPEGYLGYTEEGLQRYEFDPGKAKKLLAEAGYPNGFEVTLDSSNSPTFLPFNTAIQGQLEKVGIKVRIAVTDPPTWMKKVSSGTSQMSAYTQIRPPDADFPLTLLFHSSGFSPGPNLMRYDKLDKEIDQARMEQEEMKRLKIYHTIQKRLMEDLPAFPLFMTPYPTAYRPNIAGIPDIDRVWGFDLHRLGLVE